LLQAKSNYLEINRLYFKVNPKILADFMLASDAMKLESEPINFEKRFLHWLN
jgi:hypothetical protein